MVKRVKLEKLYCDRQFSMQEVARELKITHARVYYWLKKYRISRRTRSDSAYVKLNPRGDPFTIPQELTIHQRELMQAGLLLYWAEGNKGRDSIRIANLDSRMLQIFIRFLRDVFQVDEGRLYLYVRLHKEFSLEISRQYWGNLLGLDSSRVQVYPHTDKRSKRHKQWSQHGIATLEFHSIKLKRWLDYAMEEYISRLLG